VRQHAVTNVQGTRSYGTLNQTVEHGNLGFASLTFGDSAGTVTTLTMPVFLFYSVDYLTGSGYQTPTWQGWFGVASTNGTIDVAGSMEPAAGYSACIPQSRTTCYVVSGLKYVDYGSQVNAGFVLSPTPHFPTCDIATTGSCAPQAVLTVGVDASLEQGFSTSPLTCPPAGYVGPGEIGGYPVCQKTVNDVTITAAGASAGTYTSGAVFDTGTPYIYLSTPTNSSFPSSVEPDLPLASPHLRASPSRTKPGPALPIQSWLPVPPGIRSLGCSTSRRTTFCWISHRAWSGGNSNRCAVSLKPGQVQTHRVTT
jgi:hypothetical protein